MEDTDINELKERVDTLIGVLRKNGGKLVFTESERELLTSLLIGHLFKLENISPTQNLND